MLVVFLVVAVSLGVIEETHLFTRFTVTSAPSRNSTQAPSPTFHSPQGFYVVNSSVYLVYYSPFSQVRIGNVTFIHGGPIMAGYDGVYLVENSTPLNLGEVQFYNGTWFNITLPVFHQGPGMLPRGTLYPENGVIPF
ncbi:hypothetical protein L3N51_01644 [Metallosphaera sp. J1]|nr:hypothetical protein [Metallosphaera javensis (ex Hofmann et al. 2022)]BCS93288.1 MAG: hypothetical protein MjAS7_1896 [Metallosphaera javensis (ex Sakai et al. 2022)]